MNDTNPEQFVILGAGLAGARAATAIRDAGAGGVVTIVGDEVHQPYLRPPLSKDYLQGSSTVDSLLVHPPSWYRDHAIDLRLGTTASRIDTSRCTVDLSDGDHLPYDCLLIATGSRPRHLPIPGADLDGVRYLRRMEDSDRIRDAASRARRVTVIGAGWIGLETAASLRQAGCEVTVVESERLPLLHVLGPEVASSIAELHEAYGVVLRFGATVEAIVGLYGHVTGVELAGGEVIDADLVVVGVGVRPNVEVAQASSLEVNDGVAVDEYLRTQDPRVWAAGDVANAFNPTLGRTIRVEHWANAKDQGYTAGLNMTGRQQRYEALPFFYSDQYDVGLEYTGYAPPGSYDEVVFRGDVATREFIAFWLDGGRVIAGMNVNTWGVRDAITALITARRRVDVRQLLDVSVPLGALVAA